MGYLDSSETDGPLIDFLKKSYLHVMYILCNFCKKNNDDFENEKLGTQK